jgi:hypothetical protein
LVSGESEFGCKPLGGTETSCNVAGFPALRYACDIAAARRERINGRLPCLPKKIDLDSRSVDRQVFRNDPTRLLFRGHHQAVHYRMMKLGITHEYMHGPKRDPHCQSGWLPDAIWFLAREGED